MNYSLHWSYGHMAHRAIHILAINGLIMINIEVGLWLKKGLRRCSLHATVFITYILFTVMGITKNVSGNLLS